MKLNFSLFTIITCALSFCFACENDTASIGSIVMPSYDSLSTFSRTYPITTCSKETGAVVANTSNCFLGSLIDPESGIITTSSFLAQFHLQEEYSLPPEESVVKNEDGKVIADSCVLRIFHDKYYGDSLTTMKLTVTDLAVAMKEGETYYTDINPEAFVNKTPRIKKTVTYSVLDQNLSDTETSLSSGNYRSIPVQLGADYGTYILQNFYEHPEYFKNSFTFIEHVCPGFLVEHTGGIGTLVNSDVSTLDIYFRYIKDSKETKAWMRLGATQEVIQNTSFSHGVPSNLLTKADYTYIKSPATIHTELTLPLDKIAEGEHYNDAINSARFSLKRYANEDQNKYNLTPPQYLLLIPKSKSEEFFAKNSLPDNITTFLATYNAKNNSYEFNNISALLSHMRDERNEKAGVNLKEDDFETCKEKWEKLATEDDYWAEDGNWKKFDLIPVDASYTTSTSYYGTTTTLVGLNNDFNLHSVRLERGTATTDGLNGNILLNVIYSHFQ